jgi:hypothetical protein
MRLLNFIGIVIFFISLASVSHAQSEFDETKRLAEQGNVIAQMNLGNKYYVGEGVPQNFTEAVKWYRMAAKQGNAVAQNNLGMMYGIGRGLPKNFIRAYVWSSVAAAQGNEQAMANRDVVADELTRAQLARAQEMATRCFESNYRDCGR